MVISGFQNPEKFVITFNPVCSAMPKPGIIAQSMR